MKPIDIWAKYEKSKRYVDGAGLLRKTERNWKFYVGRQWDSIEDSKGLEDLPMMNIIKTIVKYKVATIAQHDSTAIFSDLNPAHTDHSDICDRLSKLFDISWERGKMDKVKWRQLKYAAVQGDSYLFFHDGDTRKEPQNLLNTQVLFGDENVCDIQEQPYIIIRERLPVEVAKKRAELFGVSKSEAELIQGDNDKANELYNKEEVSSKVTSLIYMEKKDGVVNIARCFKDVMYEELHPIRQTKGGQYFGKGLTRYPIISMIWEEQPNTARGVSEVEQLIPNQLEINKILARRSISIKQAAFPRLAYDAAMIDNPEDLDKVGAALKINGGGSQSISNLISYLQPMGQSSDAKILSDELIKNTKDLTGASDAAMGNFDPARVSGTALTTIRDQQQLTLNEQAAMYRDFVEDVALLYYDLWATYFPDGVNFDGVQVTTEELNGVLPNVRIDISENNTWSRTLEQQEVSNLFNNGKLTLEEFAKISPEHSNVPKDKLLEVVAERQMKLQQQQMEQQMAQQQMAQDEQFVAEQDMIPDQNVGMGMTPNEMRAINARNNL